MIKQVLAKTFFSLLLNMQLLSTKTLDQHIIIAGVSAIKQLECKHKRSTTTWRMFVIVTQYRKRTFTS